MNKFDEPTSIIVHFTGLFKYSFCQMIHDFNDEVCKQAGN